MTIRCGALLLHLCLLLIPGFTQQKTELQVRGETVTITRDNYGVPHITANSLYGIFYGNGYAIAQDRLWQMERSRRLARGQMAELMGSGAVESDKTIRITGYTDTELLAQVDMLPPEGKESILAYVDGVNAWINEAKSKGLLPAQYGEMGIEPRSWEVEDTVAIGVLMSRRFGSTRAGEGELRNFALLTYLRSVNKENAEVILNDLMWVHDPTSPTTVPPSEDTRKPRKVDVKADLARLKKHAATLPNVGLDTLLPAVRVASEEDNIRLAQAEGLVTRLGSYAILISPKKSASGNAILVGAPQMGFGVPHIAAELHLSGGGIDVAGMGFPGTPGVLIGTNPHLAWTFTSGIHDLVDTFMLKLNPDNPEQYRHKGQWVNFEKRTEEIKVKGGDPVSLDVYRSVYGPVMIIDRRNNVAFSSKMSYWMGELEFFRAFLGVYRARTAAQFRDSLRTVPVSFNAHCATQDGEIGYQYCGRAPIRADGIDPRLPVWGEGEHDWKGYMPFDELPHIVNPKQGFLVNWNNKPAVWWENVDTPVWGAIWRVERIHDLAKSKPVLTVEDVKAIFVDIASYDLMAQYIKPIILQSAKRNESKLTPEMRQAVRLLEVWDNHGREGCVPKTIFDAWVDSFRVKVFAANLGPMLDNMVLRPAFRQQASWAYYTLMGSKASVPRLYDMMKGKSRDEVVLDCLADALKNLTMKYGANMSTWRYTAPRINIPPLPSIPYDDRGSYIQVIELSKPFIVGENVLPPGQSENPKSPHYSDQRDLAGWWMFKPMRLR